MNIAFLSKSSSLRSSGTSLAFFLKKASISSIEVQAAAPV